GLLPDLTLLLDIPPDVADSRVDARDGGGSDAIGSRGQDYHAKVASAFRQLAKSEPARFVTIDGNAGPDAIHARIMAAVEPLLESRA
ncbi:MAG TPA: thymidylate kinase, partial [Sphingomonadaceae bacterium]|nr:thymidylate kinase [Sphingomonadaceae bacterium]